MTAPRIRTADLADVDAVLAFWKTAAEGTSVSDDPAGVANLIAGSRWVKPLTREA